MFLGHAPLVVERANSNFPLPPFEMAWLPSKDTLPMKLTLLSKQFIAPVVKGYVKGISYGAVGTQSGETSLNKTLSEKN